ncbi:MAG: hypothetical protein HY784_04470 [Chloroflexi bacterium]|nr:hypothetical protein [Chloroflexota bacterium]
MPVSLLLCEGADKSPDIRALAAVLSGACVVDSSGSKYGLGQRILLARQFRTGTIAGLRDRDFDDEDEQITHAPREWRVESGRVWLGWYWERHAIENYLVDPVVVARALGPQAPPEADYRAALQASAISIADYTAARLALSRSRPRFAPIPNAWGPERGPDRHPFPLDRDEARCRAAIREIVSQHQVTQSVQDTGVLRRFETFLPTCRPGGVRFQNNLTHFSGKDLLFGMEATLAQMGFPTPGDFRERILKGIENSLQNAWTWLPEWNRLRDLVRSV